MTTPQTLIQCVQSLPESAQKEVLDFALFLSSRTRAETKMEPRLEWNEFSLRAAMRGMEDEDSPYTAGDVRESAQ